MGFFTTKKTLLLQGLFQLNTNKGDGRNFSRSNKGVYVCLWSTSRHKYITLKWSWQYVWISFHTIVKIEVLLWALMTYKWLQSMIKVTHLNYLWGEWFEENIYHLFCSIFHFFLCPTFARFNEIGTSLHYFSCFIFFAFFIPLSFK